MGGHDENQLGFVLLAFRNSWLIISNLKWIPAKAQTPPVDNNIRFHAVAISPEVGVFEPRNRTWRRRQNYVTTSEAMALL
jgi:hypothetical protein